MEMFNREKKYIYVNIIVSILIMTFSLVFFAKYVFQGSPFIPQSILSDLLRANLPTYMHLYDSMLNGGNFWSWSMGIGTSMFAHADVVFDPFTYVTMFCGRDNVANMMIWAFILKLVCEGIAFSYYARNFNLHPYSVVLSSILYAFCGYSMIMGSNLALGTIMVYFPLLLLAIEKRLDFGNNSFLVVILFLTCIYSYYFYYVIGLLSIGYVVIRCHNKNLGIYEELKNIAICGMIALLLSLFIVLPQVDLTLSSARMNAGKNNFTVLQLIKPNIKALTTIMVRTVGLNFLGNAATTPYYGFSSFGSAPDYFQSELYITSLSIPVFLQWLWIEKNKIMRKRIISYSILMVILMTFPFFSFILNAFSTINYRWMFIVHLLVNLMIAYAISAIINKKEVEIKTLLISQISVILMLCFSIMLICKLRNFGAIQGFKQLFQANKLYFVVVLLIYFLSIVISFIYNKWGSKRLGKNIVIISIILIAFVDIFYNYKVFYRSDFSVPHFSNNSKYGYDDDSSIVIKKIKENDKGFYRIYKNFDSVYDDNKIPSDNDAMIQKYYGLKSYCSVNNSNYINFLQEFGVYVACTVNIPYFKKNNIEPKMVKGPDLNFINGVDDKYPLLSYLGVKYYISHVDERGNVPNNYDEYFKENDLVVYKNENCKPLGFINRNYIDYSSFSKLSYNERLNIITNHTILNDIDAQEMKTGLNNKEYDNNECRLEKFSDDNIRFYVKNAQDWRYVSFSIPFDKGWKIFVDGSEAQTKKINVSLLGVEVSPGAHTIELKYVPGGLYVGTSMSCAILIFLFILKKSNKKYLKH